MKQSEKEIQKEDSFKSRYLSKVTTNLVGFGIQFIAIGIIPRGLGPKNYGDFSFLTTFFNQVTNFFAVGTTFSYYTKLSQRLKEEGIIKFYGKFVIISSVVITALTATIVFSSLSKTVWPGQKSQYIFFALCFALLTWYSEIISKTVDAYALTIKGEIIRLSRKIIGTAMVLSLFWLKWFTLFNFFIYHFILLLFLIVAWGVLLKRNNISLYPSVKLSKTKVKSYTKEFYQYSAPLVIYSFAGLIDGIADRWLLQQFGGSVQQGFFGFALRLGSVSVLFSKAMTPLIMREFSKAYGEKNMERVRYLFVKNLPMLYAIVGFFSIFMMFQADKVAYIFAGNKFQEAGLTIAIMALYPLHQTYGQLSASLFYATGQTKQYRNIGITFMLIGLPLTFLVLAPSHLMGLNLGSIGLAVKMVLIQLVGVNVQLWYNTKYLGVSFKNLLWHQLYSVLIFTALALISVFLIDVWIENVIVSFLVSGLIYTLSTLGMLFLIPQMFSLTHSELQSMKQKVIKRLR